jgi:hypothetical protein
MDEKLTEPKQRRRSRRSVASAIFFGIALLTVAVVAALWRTRLAVATRAVRGALDRQGLADVTFALRHLTPGRVVVEDVRVGMPDSSLVIDQVDVRFSAAELLLGHIGRIAVRGVRTRLVVDGGRVTSPLYERLKPLMDQLAARDLRRGSGQKDARPPKVEKVPFSLGAATLQDLRVGVLLADGRVLDSLTFDAGLVAEPAARPPGAVSDQGGRGSAEPQPPSLYRVWGSVRAEAGVQANVAGTVDVGTGAVALSPELKIKSVERLLELVCRAAPAQTARLTAFPTNCSLTVRGAVAVQGWTNVGPFEVSAELGRGSALVAPDKDSSVRFQSLRVEASGTPRDAQCRVSVGVSGFKLRGQTQVSQEEGRLLGLRGTARFRQTATNQWVTAALDSDLPGRSVAQVLPSILPLVPAFFSEGGTLHVEAEVTRLPQAQWNGAASFRAEASRAAMPLAAGRVGAGTARVTGTVAIIGAKPDVVRTDIKIADGYFYRRGLSVRGGVDATLTAQPPYERATGVFKGRVSESIALSQLKLELEGGAALFEGQAEVTGLTSTPVWQVALSVPEFGLSSLQAGAAAGRAPGTAATEFAWHATAGAAARVRYSAASLALESDAWVRDVAAQVGPATNRAAEAGVGRIAARFQIPAINPALVSNAVVGLSLSVSNGWARAGEAAALEGLRGCVPLTWSLAKGLSFEPGQSLTWQRLEAQGLKVEPDVFALAADDEAVEATFGARLAGSKLGVTLKARVPLADLRQAVIDVAVPEAAIAAGDALANLVRDKAEGAEFSGRLAAEARVLFWGTRPHISGRVKLADGQVRKDKLSVDGLSADVPFQRGISFRTIERPFVSFMQAQAGNVKLEKGKISFQVTPKEVYVDRMEVGWCKGSLNAYSVHLDFKKPQADFIVYADRIDLGEALMMVFPFKGIVEGVLYGRFPVGFSNGHVKLSTGFLYSLPGQGGKLKLEDHAQMAALLDKAGISGEVKVPLSKALSDMDFSAFKMELDPGKENAGTLRIKLGGKSNYKEWPAPVDLNLNLHGPLEELLNMGLDVSRK